MSGGKRMCIHLPHELSLLNAIQYAVTMARNRNIKE